MRLYFYGKMSDDLAAEVQHWLGGCDDDGEVDASLRKLWNECVMYDSKPAPEVYTSLKNIWAELGFPAGKIPNVEKDTPQK